MTSDDLIVCHALVVDGVQNGIDNIHDSNSKVKSAVFPSSEPNDALSNVDYSSLFEWDLSH